MLTNVHPEFLIPAGTWAEWLAGVGTVLAIAWGVISWSRDRKRALDLLEGEQVRRVGILAEPFHENGKTYTKVTVFNSSDLPLHGASLGTKIGRLQSFDFEKVPYMRPHSEESLGTGEGWDPDWRITLSFEDNDGVKWEKPLRGRPVRVTPAPGS